MFDADVLGQGSLVRDLRKYFYSFRLSRKFVYLEGVDFFVAFLLEVLDHSFKIFVEFLLITIP